MLHLLTPCSRQNSQEALSTLDPRFPIIPKWSTTRRQLDIELNLSNRHKVPKHQCIKFLFNYLQRLKLQIQHKSTTDPFIRVILNPSGAAFDTLPIYGGGKHVAFTQFDDNEVRFKVNAQQLIDMNCTLHIQAFDSDITSTNKFIGEAELFLNTETGLIKDMHLFTQIPIKSISSKSSTKFAGKVEIAVLWTDDSLEVTILNATYLRTRDNEYKRIEHDMVLIARCLIIFTLFFVIGAAVFCKTEQWDLPIALYFLIVTTTTVGYGDIVPHTDLGKLFNCVYLLMSTVLLGWAFSIMMNYMVNMNLDKYKSIRNAVRNDEYLDHEEKMKQFKRGLNRNFLLMIIFLMIGCLFYTFISKERWHWIDSLQFSMVTMSTVGYGNIAPRSTGGRVFAVFFMIFGIVLLARFASDIMEYLLAKRHQKMMDKIMNNALVTKEQIHEFDADGSGNIDKFEYLSKMLILTNEVDADVIYKIMQRFNEIDADESGVISIDDFELKRNSNSMTRNSSSNEMVDVL